MNKIQWNVLGVGFWLLSMFMFMMTGSACLSSGDLLVACYIRRYAFSIPAIIFQALGLLFIICGFLERRR